MFPRFISLVLSVLVALLGSAWGVEFSTVEIAGKRVTVCRVNVKKERLQLFHRDENGQPFKRFDPLVKWFGERGQTLTFAMNAGMYHRDYTAVGVSVADDGGFSGLFDQFGSYHTVCEVLGYSRKR